MVSSLLCSQGRKSLAKTQCAQTPAELLRLLNCVMRLLATVPMPLS